MLFRATFLTLPDLNSDDFEPPEGLTLGSEIDIWHEGTRWRLVEIETGPGDEEATLTFEPSQRVRAYRASSPGD